MLKQWEIPVVDFLSQISNSFLQMLALVSFLVLYPQN